MKSESEILTSILALSDGSDIVLFRQQSGLFYTRDGRPVKVGVTGMPDIHGEFQGRAVWIECKKNIATSGPTPEQAVFIRAALARGTMAFCARSPERVMDMLRGPTGWHYWPEQSNVATPVFPWGPGKFLRQTKEITPSPGEYLTWLAGVCGL